MPETLFVIDAFAHIYQFFFAIKGLTGPDGEPVNAVYGFARMLNSLRQKYDPDYLAVAFDGPGELERHRLYQDYKANRPPMPEALRRQIPLIEQLLDVHGIPRLTAQGHEADDLLGTVARQAAEEGVDTVIVTTDKDAEQAISRHTRVLHVHKDREVLLDPAALKEQKGIEPWQVVEVMSLAGDPTDNVPGVPGIGPKTALKLIQQFGSVRNLYDNLDQVKSEKMRQKLAAHRAEVDLTAQLVKLNYDVPLEWRLEDCRTGGGDPEQVRSFYSALGFRSLTEEPATRPEALPRVRQSSIFGQTEAAPTKLQTAESVPTSYEAVTDVPALERLATTLRRQDAVSVDLETTSLEPRDAQIVGFAFSWQPHQGAYVATAGPPGADVCPLSEALRLLKPLLEAGKPAKLGQNLKYDIAVLKNYGVELKGLRCDSMVASYLLEPASHSHGLDALAAKHLGYQTIKIGELIGTAKTQGTMDQVPVSKVARYACEDADIALQLCRLLTQRLEEQDLWPLFRDLELPLVPVLAEMEWTGVSVDVDVLREVSEEFAASIERLERDIHEAAGEEFNVNSPQQLSRILFEKLNLPTPRGGRRATGYSTASNVLEELRSEHPIAEYVLRYRELNKLRSTYADALLGRVNAHTGRVHTSFNQTMTATGRLSSSEPNLQNIPVRTALGRRIRQAFVPGANDMSILSADYSQVELRIMAHCSGDETLLRAFAEDRDIHRFVAAQVNDVPEDQVTGEMRQKAKAINFGIIYGLSSYGLSRQIGIPLAEAEAFISAYFSRYPKVKEFIGHTIDQARRRGYVETLAGRRRKVDGLRSTGATRSAAERIAVNTVIQGSAADLIKRAMIAIHRELPAVSPRTRMLMQIHDELVFETPDDEVEEVKQFVTKQMASALKLDVELKVATATGKNWAEAK